VKKIHQCVTRINEAVKSDSTLSIVAMLVMESAANILNATPAWPSVCDETQDEQEDADPDTDEENEVEDDGCYAFHTEDYYPIGKLIEAIEGLSDREELSPETRDELRIFLFAMERLPLVTPGIRMSLALRIDQGGESDWREIRFEDDEFSLGGGSWVDGDADTEKVFEVSKSYRDGDAFSATGFAEYFTECAEDVCREVVTQDYSDEPFTGWDLPKDKKRWGSLPCDFL
jgi:hypothetical protein